MSRRSRSIAAVMSLTLLLATTSCAWMAKRMARGIADTTIEKSVDVPVGSLKAFWNCFGSPGGSCPEASVTAPYATTVMPEVLTKAMKSAGYGRDGDSDLGELARKVLESDVHTQIVSVYNLLMEESRQRVMDETVVVAKLGLDLEWNKLVDFAESLDRALQNDAFEVLRRQVRVVTDANPKLGVSSEVVAYQGYLGFVTDYLKAYFRNGDFFEVKVDLAGLKDRIKADLKARLGLAEGPELDALVEKILNEFLSGVNNEYAFGNIGDVGFVTRAGAKYQFPAIEAKLDPTADDPLTVTKIEPVVVGNDLVRVFLEASFDAWGRLPCVSNATGSGAGLPSNEPTQATTPDSQFLTAEHFEAVESWANATESGSSALVGRLVRGGGWIALNNEALAQLVETIVGVIVRKFTEKAAWCAYSCKGGKSVTRAEIASEMTPRRLAITVRGRPPIYDQDPWRKAKPASERAKL